MMIDEIEGNGYEFSFRMPDGRRLFVHVTKRALESIARRSQGSGSLLSTLARNASAVRAIALKHHDEAGLNHVVLSAKDVEKITPC